MVGDPGIQGRLLRPFQPAFDPLPFVAHPRWQRQAAVAAFPFVEAPFVPPLVPLIPFGYDLPILPRWPRPVGWTSQVSWDVYFPPIGPYPNYAIAEDSASFVAATIDSQGGGPILMDDYEIDTQIETTVTFLNVGLNVPADPTAVTLFILDPLGNETSVAYNPGPITRSGIGVYGYVFVPSSPGVWTYKWQGVGAVIATSRDRRFFVRASSLIQ